MLVTDSSVQGLKGMQTIWPDVTWAKFM